MKSRPFCASVVCSSNVGSSSSPSTRSRWPTASLIAFVPSARVVCSKEKLAPTSTPSTPIFAWPVARIRSPEKVSVGPPAIARLRLPKFTVLPLLPRLTSSFRSSTSKVKPLKPTIAAWSVVMLSAK